MDIKYLTELIFDWGTRCFGIGQMQDPQTRALRFVEEAVELNQALGVPKDAMHHLVSVVYSRPRGEPTAELGGCLLTLMVLARTLHTDLEAAFQFELRRVLSKPREHFAERNKEKLDLGIGEK